MRLSTNWTNLTYKEQKFFLYEKTVTNKFYLSLQ